MKKIIIAASLLTACVAFANPYAKCVACHGATGEKVALGKSKIIKERLHTQSMCLHHFLCGLEECL